MTELAGLETFGKNHAIKSFLKKVPDLDSSGLEMSRRWAEEIAAEIEELLESSSGK